jgi:hypothetical protein
MNFSQNRYPLCAKAAAGAHHHRAAANRMQRLPGAEAAKKHWT